MHYSQDEDDDDEYADKNDDEKEVKKEEEKEEEKEKELIRNIDQSNEIQETNLRIENGNETNVNSSSSSSVALGYQNEIKIENEILKPEEIISDSSSHENETNVINDNFKAQTIKVNENEFNILDSYQGIDQKNDNGNNNRNDFV